MLIKPRKPLPLLETESEPQPGEFAIGSDKSRAAARMLASRKENSEFKIQINTSIPRPVVLGGGQPRPLFLSMSDKKVQIKHARSGDGTMPTIRSLGASSCSWLVRGWFHHA
jgi:hypothetical protein